MKKYDEFCSHGIHESLYCASCATEIASKLAIELKINKVLREALEFECGNICAHQNPCNARDALAQADKIRSGE